MAGGFQLRHGLVDAVHSALGHGLLGVFQRHFHRLDVVGAHFVAMLLQHLFDVVDQRIGLVAGFDFFLLAAIVGRVQIGVLRHFLHFVLAQSRGRRDGDLVFVVGGFVLRAHVDDAVRVDVEAHFDLGDAARSRRDAHQLEYPQHLVVGGHGALALVHLDFNRSLVVGRGGKRLALARRDGGIAFDQLGENAAQSFDPQRQRGDVQQQHVLHFSAQHAALNGRADGYHFVRIHALVGFLAKQGADDLLHFRNSGGTAHQHHFVDLLGGDAGVRKRPLARLDAAFQNVGHHVLESRPRKFDVHVLRTAGVGRQERQIQFGLKHGGKLDLGFFGGFLQTLQGHLVLRNVHPGFLLEILHQPVNDALVDVVAAQVGVSVGGFHFHDAVAHFQNRDVERSAAEIVNRDRFVLLLVQAVGQGGRSGLIDDAHHFQTGNLPGVLGSLALGVVEVGGNGDDGLQNFFAQIGLGGFLELA